MGIDAERLEKIRANAAFVIGELGKLSDIEFGLDPASVAWTQGFIERQRVHLDGPATDGIVTVLGSYLGEAIIAAVPGTRWEEDAGGNLGVLFPGGDMAFPFVKVAKQFADGVAAGESILSFYNISVKYVAAGKLGKAPESEAP
jgi:hypothetical protein